MWAVDVRFVLARDSIQANPIVLLKPSGNSRDNGQGATDNGAPMGALFVGGSVRHGLCSPGALFAAAMGALFARARFAGDFVGRWFGSLGARFARVWFARGCVVRQWVGWLRGFARCLVLRMLRAKTAYQGGTA